MKEKEKKPEIERRVYGISGYVEFQMEIPTGHPAKPYVRIHFTGGQITGYGVTPARFVTCDETLARLIEQSPMFRNHRIKRLVR